MKSIANHFSLAAIIVAPLATVHAFDNLEPVALRNAPARGQGAESPAFRDEPQARVLYDKMTEALRKPRTLSYKSDYRWEARGDEIGRCTYRVWLKEPNYFRVEAARSDGRLAGTIVGDGDTLWLFWAGVTRQWS